MLMANQSGSTLDKTGQVTTNQANKDYANSFIKVDGVWKTGNYKTGRWDTMSEQGHDFSTKTGALTLQHGKGRTSVYEADGRKSE